METRGGKREGAGRPKKGYVALSVRLSEEVAEVIKQRATQEGKSQGEIISDAIMESIK